MKTFLKYIDKSLLSWYTKMTKLKLHFEKKSNSWYLLRESRWVKRDQIWYYEDGLFVLVVE